MEIKVKLTRETASIPTKKHNEDAGWDLYSPTGLTIYPGDSRMIPLGLCLEIPDGWFGEIKDRSSLAKSGVYTAGGVIDARYRGEISVLIRNDGYERLEINSGDRIAQLLILPVPDVTMVAAEILSDTERGSGGFGSTGK